MSLAPQDLILFLPVILFALSFHELGHAWVALRFGDPTARDQGRVSLDPRRHLDPIGTLLVFVAGFGWAKPVPIDPSRLKNPLRDGLWIAAAGPGANLLTAIASGLVLQGLVRLGAAELLPGSVGEATLRLCIFSVHVNLGLMAFNLIPLHPLDGAAVLKGLVSPGFAARLAQLDQIGPILLLGLLVLGRATGGGLIGSFIGPVVGTLSQWVSGGLL